MLRRLFGECGWNKRKKRRNQRETKSASSYSISDSTLVSSVTSDVSGYSSIPEIQNPTSGASSLQQKTADNDEKFNKRRTPVLFSTNRGLYLRVPKATVTTSSSKMKNQNSDDQYEISFCDLERWSTNRAHTINLEDTFTIARQRRTESSISEESDSPLQLHVPTSRNACFYRQTGRFNNRFSCFD